MKIFKARNGIALVAVLVIMLISSLFIPLMFNLSDSSLMIAVKGTDRQRASYLARTVTEMSVAAFKKFDTIPGTQLTSAQRQVKNGINELVAGTRSEIKTTPIAMFSTMVEGTAYYLIKNDTRKQISYADYIVYSQRKQDILNAGEDLTFDVDSVESTQENPIYVEEISYELDGSEACNNKKNNSAYKYLGKGECTLTYEGGTKYYKKIISTGEVIEITSKSEYDNLLNAYINAVSAGNVASLDYEISTVNSKNIYFTSTATVNGATSKRSCVLVLQTYPTEENWFIFKPESGGNQIFVDPTKATSRVPIEYDRGIAGLSNYKGQSLLVYSSVGNMIIANGAVKEVNGTSNSAGVNNSQFVLGVEPGLNTTPNNDPSWAILDGANYDASIDMAQMNNFVAFTSTKAIRVDLPINLMVNPCRGNRLGDGTQKNGSLFKIMLFQAPDIIFQGRLDMMMSFYVRGSEDARRMSSVVLNAPSGTPYHYDHDNYGTVRAGRVFFAEDSYLWIIPYGDDGSASSWAGLLSETVYKRDSDFQKIKIANAGDVYYFNAEVTQTKDVVDEDGNPVDNDGVEGTDTVTDLVGFSLTGYFLETQYLPNYQESNTGSGWQVWKNTQAAIFGAYMEGQLNSATYVADDFHYVGNVNDGVSLIEYPEVDDYYVIWNN